MVKYKALLGEKFDKSKITVVGSPTITSDGVASGFSINDYVRTPALNFTQPFKLDFEFNTNILNTEQYLLVSTSAYLWAFVTQNNDLYIRLGTTSWGGDIVKCNYTGILANTDYKVSIQFNGATYEVFVNGDKVYQNNTTTTIPNSSVTVNIGREASTNYLRGTFNLAKFKYTSAQSIYSPTKPTYLLERRKEGYDPSKFTIVGSPTITEYGVASGFNDNSYIKNSLSITSQKIKINGEFTFGTDLTTFQNCFDLYSESISRYIISIRPISDNFLAVCYYNGTGTEVVNYNQTEVPRIANKSYEFEIEIDGTTAKSTINGITKTINNFVFADVTGFYLGNGYGLGIAFKGSINLPSTSITADGKEVFTGAKENYYMLSV